jgi:hypothetical protein
MKDSDHHAARLPVDMNRLRNSTKILDVSGLDEVFKVD